MGDYLLSGIKTDASLSLDINVRGTPHAPCETLWINGSPLPAPLFEVKPVPTHGRDRFSGAAPDSIT